MKKIILNPFILFFTLGIIFGLSGVLLWVLWDFKLITFYPKLSHINIMFFCFLWSFASGFLMTAIPRMTKTFSATLLEINCTLFLLITQFLVNIIGYSWISTSVLFLQNSLLLLFIFTRLWKTKALPFQSFLFVLSAIFMNYFGLVIYTLTDLVSINKIYLLCGEAFFLNLIIGLGSRIIPFFSRFAISPNVQSKSQITTQFYFTLMNVLLINLTYIIEIISDNSNIYLIRLIFLFVIFYKSMGFLKKPQEFSWLAVGVKLSLISMLLFNIVKSFQTNSNAGVFHILFLGGFALITIMVATRVSLAHSGVGTSKELSFKHSGIIVIFILLATILRWYSENSISGNAFYISMIMFFLGLMYWLIQHILNARYFLKSN